MKTNYVLDPSCAKLGRTLWNNLVVSNKKSTLEDEEGYKRITEKEKIYNHCEFSYKNIATILVVNPNFVAIRADTSEDLISAEKSLESICESKACPLIELAYRSP